MSVNADGGALRCEPSVAIAGRDIVVAWNDSWGGQHGSPTGVAVAWSLSRDAGQTFRFGGYLPEVAADRLPSGADSQIVADEQGNFYLEVLTWQQASQAILIYVMDHGAIGSWQRVTTAVSVEPGTGAFLDRPSLAWDSHGHLDVSYTTGQPGAHKIAVASSHDRGRTFSDPVTVSATTPGARGGSAVARSGHEMIVAWMEGDGVKQPSEGWYAHSADDGKSFAAPALLYRLTTTIGVVPGYVMGFSPDAHTGLGHYVSIAPLDAHLHQGSFVLAAMDKNATGPGIRLFSWMADEKSWSEPRRLNQGSHSGQAFFPSVTTVQDLSAVLHYYRDENGASGLTDVYLTVFGGGQPEHLRLNAVATDWTRVEGDKDHAPIQRNFGDYVTVAASGSRVVAVWTDGRSGQPRIYCRVLEKSVGQVW